MAPPETPEIGPFVDALRGYVRHALGGEPLLDFSEESLAFIDHYIEKTRGETIDASVLALIAPALGAYFGETAIARFGGRWLIEGHDPSKWRIELSKGELKFTPAGMAAAALVRDEIEGWDASFAPRPGLREALAAALARVPPVEEAYYYSLTGRFETLAHALDLIVEIERLAREKPPTN
jgi:hypothetical protein